MLEHSVQFSGVVDALPYVDAGYDAPGVRDAVAALVEEEMKRYQPARDYLQYLPRVNADKFQTERMKIEAKRMDENKPMEKLDFKKYQQTKPAVNRRRDPTAWEECFNRVAVLHSHMTNRKAIVFRKRNRRDSTKRFLSKGDTLPSKYFELKGNLFAASVRVFTFRLANLQLQADYGAEVWRQFIPTMERQLKLVETDLKDARNRIQEVNWDRKNSQLKAGEQLALLENSWVELVGKNFEIERACLEMEARIEEWEFRLAKQQPESDEEGSESSSDHPILADDQHDLSAGADPTTDVPTAESEPLADSHDETILTEERTEKVQAEIES